MENDVYNKATPSDDLLYSEILTEADPLLLEPLEIKLQEDELVSFTGQQLIIRIGLSEECPWAL